MNTLQCTAAMSDGEYLTFPEAVTRYGDRIVCFLDRFLNDHGRANDLAQETLLRFHDRIWGTPNTHPGDPTSLLFTIAANLGRDELRRRQTRRETPLTLANETIATGTPSPIVGVEQDERRQCVRTALALLPEDDRVLLILREVQELRYEQISEILAIPLSTLKSRIIKARFAFRDAWMCTNGKELDK